MWEITEDKLMEEASEYLVDKKLEELIRSLGYGEKELFENIMEKGDRGEIY